MLVYVDIGFLANMQQRNASELKRDSVYNEFLKQRLQLYTHQPNQEQVGYTNNILKARKWK